MNYRIIAHYLGTVLLILAGLLVLPLIVGICYGEGVSHFLIAISAALIPGLCLITINPKTKDFFARDGYVLVGLSWLLISVISSMPFMLSGDIPNFCDAFFETVSGLTTTGSTIMTNMEAMSRGCMFWRMFTHWIGGMGVLVFIMAVLPLAGERSMHIMRAEVPGPSVGKLVPKVRSTARLLYLIYIGITCVEIVLLLLGGMSFYDAVTHAFSTVGTGGFSTHTDGIGYFDSLYIEMVLSVFMLICGINFNLYYLILKGHIRDALKNEELKWFLTIVAASSAVIALGTSGMYGGVLKALRYSFFTVSSIITTTGFGTTDYLLWPAALQTIIVFLLFIGGCGGSTGGGLKVSRVMILLKSAAADIKQMLNPRSVPCPRLEGKRIEEKTIRSTYLYFSLYVLLILLLTFVVSFDGYDFATNFTAALTCVSNVGPGLGKIGLMDNFSLFSGFSKIALAFGMLFGRLEIYAMIVLFSPSTWKRK